METDTLLVSGLFLVVLSIPALVSAWADSRRPIVGTLLLFVGCGLTVWAHKAHPGGYTAAQIPDALYHVIGMMMR